jgi:ATP-dependent helicase/nuclease subunit B
MDAMEIEDVDPARMQTLVPDTFAQHWERTLAFLGIVTEAWPAHLEEHGLVSKMRHDKQLVLAQAHRLRQKPPGAPVIVAGVMSSVPAVTELLGVVAGLPNGALVLPGLDQALDEESWNAIVPQHPEHPQFGLKKLLDALGVRREDVLPLPGSTPDAPQHARASLLSEAMRPARTTERWHRYMAGVGLEAKAGACRCRHPRRRRGRAGARSSCARWSPGRNGGAGSPDRALRAAGRPSRHGTARGGLGRAAAGRDRRRRAFLDLVIEAAATRFSRWLMALLKHPLCRLGMAAGDCAGRRSRLAALSALLRPRAAGRQRGAGEGASRSALRQTPPSRRPAWARGGGGCARLVPPSARLSRRWRNFFIPAKVSFGGWLRLTSLPSKL